MILGAFLGLSVASCADQNFDWEEARNQNPEYTFRSNFEKLVGEIDPNQSWDFSSSALWSTRALATRAGEATPSKTITVTEYDGSNAEECGIKDGDTGFDTDGWYTVQNGTGQTIDWLNKNLPEGKEANRQKGSPFTMLMPETESFTIVPVYQGEAGHKWYLEVVEIDADGTEHSKYIWAKNNNVQYKTKSSDKNWTDLGYYHPETNEYYQSRNGTMNVAAIRVKAYTISGIAKGKEIYFRLWNADEQKYAKSTVGNMVILACPRPTNLDSSHEVRILGCEDRPLKRWPGDSDGAYGDDDMNDVVFMIIGNPTVPKEEILTSKRYMVEDLGSTAESDIDFNDIVIDIESRQPGYNRYNETTKKSEFIAEGAPKQTARVWALGGTLDLQLMLVNDGVYTPIFTKSEHFTHTSMLNTTVSDPAFGYNKPLTNAIPIPGTLWKPSENNVAVLVSRDKSKKVSEALEESGIAFTSDGLLTQSQMINIPDDGKLQLVNFPEAGGTPFVIAFDPGKQWRDERHAVCKHWLFDGKLNDGLKCTSCGEK